MKKRGARIIRYLDTTLRDGSQGAGISFTVEDKLKIARALDEFGMHFVEGGWPGSNPKDELFFREARRIRLKTARLTAFGSTRHKAVRAHEDKNLRALVASGVSTACIFGKSWDLHVIHALRSTREENLRMIAESVAWLRSRGLGVIYDAEHFFDGYLASPEYALATLRAAAGAGAMNITLCETNGGMLPHRVREIVRAVRAALPGMSFGIHTHNDSGCAVANSIEAAAEGCDLVQGTINGYGERCGNANLSTIIPGLQLGMAMSGVPAASLARLTKLSRYVDEISNVIPDERQPYVGASAFAHKAGIHVAAVARNASTYEHADPAAVGNVRRILISELSGKSNIASKGNELALDFDHDPEAARKIIAAVKDAEHQGYQFEDADGSFAILARKALGTHRPSFMLKGFRVSVEKDVSGHMVSEATVKLDIDGKEEHTVAEGDGPVNALDGCLRKALVKHFPAIAGVSLRDFKVRVINAGASTAARVRVFIESRDNTDSWGTVGVSENIIEASWQALADAVEYKLLKGHAVPSRSPRKRG